MLTTPGCRPVPVVLTVLLLASCHRDAGPDTPTLPIDSVGVRIVESDPSSSDATCTIGEEPRVVIGDDETDERQWFSSIPGAGRLSDGSIVAVDRATGEVRIYDETGGHLRSMGGMGEGPGEFDDPNELWVTAGDTLWVGDATLPWRYNVFASEGDFVRQVNLNPFFRNSSLHGGVLDNGYSVNSKSKYVLREGFDTTDTLLVQIHDRDGNLVGTLARMPDKIRGVVKEVPDLWLSPLFQSFARVDAVGSTIALAHGRDTEVRVLDEEFNLRTIIRWFEPDREVTGADVRAWREDYIKRRNRPASGPWSRFDDARVSTNRPVSEIFPAISSMRVGRDGRIWVRQYDRPREDRRWLSFSAGGEFVCHLAPLPGSVWEFGSDYVLLTAQTELGTQTVRLYRMHLPTD